MDATYRNVAWSEPPKAGDAVTLAGLTLRGRPTIAGHVESISPSGKTITVRDADGRTHKVRATRFGWATKDGYSLVK